MTITATTPCRCETVAQREGLAPCDCPVDHFQKPWIEEDEHRPATSVEKND